MMTNIQLRHTYLVVGEGPLGVGEPARGDGVQSIARGPIHWWLGVFIGDGMGLNGIPNVAVEVPLHRHQDGGRAAVD